MNHPFSSCLLLPSLTGRKLRDDHKVTIDQVICTIEMIMGTHRESGPYHVKWYSPGLVVCMLVSGDGLISVSTQIHYCSGFAEWYGFEELALLDPMIRRARAVARGR